MAGEYDNLLAGYSPEFTGAEPPRNRLDDGPSLAEMLQRYGPRGSAEMEKRGPVFRELMPDWSANLLAALLKYAPMALPASRAGATVARDNVLAGQLERRFPPEPRQAYMPAGTVQPASNPRITGADTRHSIGEGVRLSRGFNEMAAQLERMPEGQYRAALMERVTEQARKAEGGLRQSQELDRVQSELQRLRMELYDPQAANLNQRFVVHPGGRKAE